MFRIFCNYNLRAKNQDKRKGESQAIISRQDQTVKNSIYVTMYKLQIKCVKDVAIHSSLDFF